MLVNTTLVIKMMSRPNVNGSVGNYVPVPLLKMNPLNAKLYTSEYATKNSEYIEGLKESIIDKGLDKPIRTYNDGKTLIDGHHRLLAMKKAGFTEIPIDITDIPVSDIEDNPLGTMELLARNNMTHANLYTDWQRWESATTYREMFKKENEYDIIKSEYIDFGKAISFSWDKIQSVEKLLYGYEYTIPKGNDRGTKEWIAPRCGEDGKSDLIGRLIKDEHSISHCVKTQIKDHFINKAESERPFLDAHTDLDLEQAVRNVLKEAQKYVQAVKGYTANFYGEEVALGASQDANVLTGMLHGGVTKLLPTALKHELGIESEAPDFGAHFDVVADEDQDALDNKSWELEVKTSAGLNERWTTGSVKTGYNLFVRSNSDFTRFAAFYVYVPDQYLTLDKSATPVWKDCWVGSGGMFTNRKLDKNCLFRLLNPMMPKIADNPVRGKVLVGDIEFTSREGVQIHTEKLD